MADMNLPKFCPQASSQGCALVEKNVTLWNKKRPYVLIMSPYGPEGRYDDTILTIKTVVSDKKLGGKNLRAILSKDFRMPTAKYCKICQCCWFAEFGIAELGDTNSNVMMEIGLMFGFGKPVIFTMHKDFVRLEDLPFNVDNFMHIPYQSKLYLSPELDKYVDSLIELRD